MSPRSLVVLFLLALATGLAFAGSAAAVQRCVLMEYFFQCT